MAFRIGLAQCGFPSDGDVVSMVERFAAEAQTAGCSLLVFPEDLMSPRPLTIEELRGQAEPVDGPFARAVGAAARRHGLWVVATMSETVGRDDAPNGRAGESGPPPSACDEPAGPPPYNTAVVFDDAGAARRVYRKCHLYDAHGVYESDRMTAGDALCEPARAPFCTLGVGICYDLRFPESARAAALAGCDLVVYPACWYDGPEKAEHWRTLLRARAIENELFVAGACRAGERYVGRSLVADPLGRVLAEGPAGCEANSELLVTCEIDVDAVAAARDAMPVLEHRRPDVY